MPRINAPSIAEHRESRRTSLLDAASLLLETGGEAAVTMSAVALEAGLSRPAVYEYFDSTDDLLAAVIGKEADAWSSELREMMNADDSPEAQISTYLTAAAQKRPAPGVLEAATIPLVPALNAIGVQDVAAALSLLQACACSGADAELTCAFALGGLRNL